jgi:uncharacterized protein YcbX
MITIRRLSITAVKGTQLREVEAVRLERLGVRENRRFYLIDDQDEMVNSLRLGELQTAVFSYSEDQRTLRLELPDHPALEEPIRHGTEVATGFYGGAKAARLVDGPWSEVLSGLVGKPLRLVEAGDEGAVDRGADGAVTVISRASLRRLAEEGALDGIDGRRFRMLIEVDGLDAHAEDAWVGSSVRLGQALVGFAGNVGRCNITSRHPVTGESDTPTLKLLGRYRRDVESTEPLPFGIYGRVLEPGLVRLGDAVTLEPGSDNGAREG